MHEASQQNAAKSTVVAFFKFQNDSRFKDECSLYWIRAPCLFLSYIRMICNLQQLDTHTDVQLPRNSPYGSFVNAEMKIPLDSVHCDRRIVFVCAAFVSTGRRIKTNLTVPSVTACAAVNCH